MITTDGTETGLLAGVGVLDLSTVLAGPFAGQALAEMGADVVKVEPPGGDPARGIGPFLDGRSLYFSSLNTGKRSVVLDLTTPAGREAFDALAARADVVIENLRPAAAVRLGCAADQLLARHPRLVVVSISGFRRDSSRSDEPAYDVTAQAEAGLMGVTGEPGRPPVRAGAAVADLAAGLWAVVAATAGLAARARTGQGRHLEVPLVDSALTLLAYLATGALGSGIDPGPVGSGHHSIVPYGAYPARDGWIVIAVIGDKFWPRLCEALGLDDLGGRPDLAANRDRVTARPEIDDAITTALAALTVEEAAGRLAHHGVPNAPVRSVLEALTAPYVTEQGRVATIPVAGGSYRVVQGPLRTGGQPRPAPLLGEHTREVLAGVLGETSALLARLTG